MHYANTLPRFVPPMSMGKYSSRGSIANAGVRVRILAYTAKTDDYNRSLFPALNEVGAEVSEGVFSSSWLAANRNNFDCVHINWPHLFYSAGKTGKLTTLKNFARFVRFILMPQLWGIPVYWTAHNLYPHEKCEIPGVDWLARRLVISVSRRVFVHGPTAAGILAEEFPSVRQKIVIIDHGHWVDLYPRDCSRKDARNRFGLGEDEFVFLFAGLCREYKNLDGLIQTFEKLEGNSRLIIAGAFLSEAYYRQIRDLADRQPPGRVVLRAGFVPDEEMQYLMTAADAVVLPYTDVLTSGAAVLALSFGRPVVAPRKGYLVDLVGSDCGVLYTIGDGESLLSAMCSTMNRQFDEKRITTRALQHDWGYSARRIMEEMREEL